MFLVLICTFYHQDETYEKFLGEWAEKRGIQDQLAIAMKVRSKPPVCSIQELMARVS